MLLSSEGASYRKSSDHQDNGVATGTTGVMRRQSHRVLTAQEAACDTGCIFLMAFGIINI